MNTAVQALSPMSQLAPPPSLAPLAQLDSTRINKAPPPALLVHSANTPPPLQPLPTTLANHVLLDPSTMRLEATLSVCVTIATQDTNPTTTNLHASRSTVASLALQTPTLTPLPTPLLVSLLTCVSTCLLPPTDPLAYHVTMVTLEMASPARP